MRRIDPAVEPIVKAFREVPWAAFLPSMADLVAELDAAGVPEQFALGGVPRKLNSAQERVARSQAFINWFLASNRVGKSFLGSLTTAWFANGQHPFVGVPDGIDLIWVGFPDWKNHGAPIIKPLLRRMLGPAAKWHEKDAYFKLPRPGVGDLDIFLKTYESGPTKFQGAAPGFIWLDELVPEAIYDELMARVGGQRFYILNTLTPIYEAAWVYNLFETWRDNGRPPDISFLHGEIDENPHLDPEMVQQMKDHLRKDPDQYKIRVKGEWAGVGGRVYPNLRASERVGEEVVPVHVVPDFEIPGVHRDPFEKGHVLPNGVEMDADEQPWTLYRALDVGIRSPAPVLWVAVDPHGLAYVYREMYRNELSIPEICKIALEMQFDREQFLYSVIDPAAAQRDPATKEARVDTYAQNGIICIKGNNDRQSGISKMRQAFHFRLDEAGNLAVPPKYRFFQSCPNTWREHRQLAWTPAKSTGLREPKDDAQKKDDHTCDALRYLEATGRGPIFVPRKKKDPFHQYRSSLEEGGDPHTGW